MRNLIETKPAIYSVETLELTNEDKEGYREVKTILIKNNQAYHLTGELNVVTGFFIQSDTFVHSMNTGKTRKASISEQMKTEVFLSLELQKFVTGELKKSDPIFYTHEEMGIKKVEKNKITPEKTEIKFSEISGLIKNIEIVVSKIEDIMEIEFDRTETKDSIQWNERYTDIEFCKKTETIRVIHYHSKQQILLSNTIDFCEKLEFLKEPIVGFRFHSQLEYELNEIGLI